MRSRFFHVIAFTSLLGLALWIGDIALDRRYQLAIVEPTPLLSITPIDYPTFNPVLTTLQPEQPVKVLRMRYGKDFQTFKIEVHLGITGWVIVNQGIRVISPNQ